MVQAPLPTGIPASVASYCASSLPWAKTDWIGPPSQKATAQRLPIARTNHLARRGEIMLWVVTKDGPLGSGIGNSSNQINPADNAYSEKSLFRT